jgi:hypothetical protein
MASAAGSVGTLTLDDLAGSEIGDWKMPAFKAACSFAVSQGWADHSDDVLAGRGWRQADCVAGNCRSWGSARRCSPFGGVPIIGPINRRSTHTVFGMVLGGTNGRRPDGRSA